MRSVLGQYAITKHDGVLLRFAGGYQSEDSTNVDAIEIVIRGRQVEGRHRVQGHDRRQLLQAVRERPDVIEIDFVNMIEKVNGNDLFAALRNAIGL